MYINIMNINPKQKIILHCIQGRNGTFYKYGQGIPKDIERETSSPAIYIVMSLSKKSYIDDRDNLKIVSVHSSIYEKKFEVHYVIAISYFSVCNSDIIGVLMPHYKTPKLTITQFNCLSDLLMFLKYLVYLCQVYRTSQARRW